MGIRKYNPTTPGRRGATVSDFAELTPGAKPEKSLLRPKIRTNGRNNQGKITSRHRGGGHRAGDVCTVAAAASKASLRPGARA